MLARSEHGHCSPEYRPGFRRESDCVQRLATAADEADLALSKGVMGLHDGEPRVADRVLRFQVPVLAVVDASTMAGTLAAVAHGVARGLVPPLVRIGSGACGKALLRE